MVAEILREHEIERQICAVSAVMHLLFQSVMVKKKRSRNVKRSIYLFLYVPTLTYGHVLWVITKRSQIQAAKMSFLLRVAGCTESDAVRSHSVTREELGVELLLLRIKRSQLGHLFRMPPWRGVPGMSRWEEASRKTTACWRGDVSRLEWERLKVPPDKQEEMTGAKEVRTSLQRFC